MHKEESLEIADREAVWDMSYPEVQPNGMINGSGINHQPFFQTNGHHHGELYGTVEWYWIKKVYSRVDVDDYFLKRPFDIIVSLLGIVICLPLWVLIALSIWVEDRGPIFYCCERVGKGGRVFRAFKFRTMVVDSDMRYGPLQAQENDHRITRVGGLLRATAMDEIPQLWNVLKGEMSMVGPRALLPIEIEVKRISSNGDAMAVPLTNIPGYWKRHSVKPGLTGLAQIYAPRDLIRKQKFRYDMLYIKDQNLWLDTKFIILSFWITVRGKWESRGKKF